MKAATGRRARALGKVLRLAVATALLAITSVAMAASGDLDGGFGAGGIVDVDLGAERSWLDVDALVLGDGRIVLGGTESAGLPHPRWTIRTFTASGEVDAGFGTGGALSVFGDGPNDLLVDLALDGSGRILAVGGGSVVTTTTNRKNGKTTVSTQLGAGLVRITASGSLDAGFGTGGKVFTQVPGAWNTWPVALTVQPDGRILVAGNATFATTRKGKTTLGRALYLARYLADGRLDTSFGTDGIVVHDRTSEDDVACPRALALQSDGRIVVGSSSGAVPDTTGDWIVTRYLPNGAVDTGFLIDSAGDRLLGLAVDANDRIVAVGMRFLTTATSDLLARRYDASGAPDLSFGSGGATTLDLGELEALAWGLRVASDGAIVACGIVQPDSDTGDTYGVLVRLDPDGELDAAFGDGGVVGPIQISATNTEPMAVDVAADGKLIVAGRYAEGVYERWFLARLLGE